MKKRVKIDDLFRQGANQNPVPFEEKYWHQAEELLDARKKKPWFRTMPYLVLTLSAIIISALGIVILSSNNSGNQNNEAISQSTQITQENNSLNEKGSSTVIPENGISESNNRSSGNDNFVSNNQVPTNINSNTAVATGGNDNLTDDGNENSTTPDPGIDPNSDPGISPNSNINTQTDNASANSLSQTLENGGASQEGINGDPNTQSQAQKTNHSSAVLSGTVLANTTNSASGQIDEPDKNSNKPVNTADKPMTELGNMDSDGPITSGLNPNETVLLLAFEKSVPDLSNDDISLPDLITDRFNTGNKKSGFSKLHYFIHGGISISPAWKEGSDNSIDPIAGIGINYSLSPSFDVYAGLNYLSRSNLALNKISRSLEYSFGVEGQSLILNVKKLHLVQMPIGFTYKFSIRHSVDIGINLVYMVNTGSDLETQTRLDAGAWDIQNTRETGYTDGFNRFSYQAGVGYNYRISELFSLRARFNYGLNDMVDNNYFGLPGNERLTDFQISLKYHIK